MVTSESMNMASRHKQGGGLDDDDGLMISGFQKIHTLNSTSEPAINHEYITGANTENHGHKHTNIDFSASFNCPQQKQSFASNLNNVLKSGKKPVPMSASENQVYYRPAARIQKIILNFFES